MRYKITTKYYNYICDNLSFIDLYWNIPEGFKTLEGAKKTLKKIKQPSSEYSFIHFLNYYYPINYKTVITKKHIYTLKDKYGYNVFSIKDYNKCNFNGYTGILPRWKREMQKYMLKIDKNYFFIDKEQKFNEVAIISTFGGIFFDTFIDSYELNCIFRSINTQEKEKLKNLGDKGITRINPFSYKIKVRNNRQPYTPKMYKKIRLK